MAQVVDPIGIQKEKREVKMSLRWVGALYHGGTEIWVRY